MTSDVHKDFKRVYLLSGKVQYEHIENGKKRMQLIKDMQDKKITLEQFQSEQKKMRGGKYLKCLYSEAAYLRYVANNGGLDG